MATTPIPIKERNGEENDVSVKVLTQHYAT